MSAADLNLPVQAFSEYAISQPVHFGEIVYELALVVGCNKLHHCCLPALYRHGKQRNTASASSAGAQVLKGCGSTIFEVLLQLGTLSLD